MLNVEAGNPAHRQPAKTTGTAAIAPPSPPMPSAPEIFGRDRRPSRQHVEAAAQVLGGAGSVLAGPGASVVVKLIASESQLGQRGSLRVHAEKRLPVVVSGADRCVGGAEHGRIQPVEDRHSYPSYPAPVGNATRGCSGGRVRRCGPPTRTADGGWLPRCREARRPGAAPGDSGRPRPPHGPASGPGSP